MRRRAFLISLGAASTSLLAGTPSIRAQQSRIPVVGVLALGNPPPDTFLKALRAGLQQVGYSEGRNLVLDIRIAEGSAELLARQAAELVAAKVDVVVAYQTPAASAAKQATREIPIPVVFGATGDPVGTGLVESYARPGGNLTGTTAGAVEVAGKMVELICELLPSARRFAALANDGDIFTKSYLTEIARVARIVNLDLNPVMVQPGAPLNAAFESMAAARAEAVIIQGSLVSQDAVELANKHGLPSIGSSPVLPRMGGLMSYAADFNAMLLETANFVDKILRGAKPAELPVTFPAAFQMILNLKTAKALDITVSDVFLQRANEVIE
ncbi:MAG: ABC transporter substrate-binding protein [Hyphomicrobium sp.]